MQNKIMKWIILLLFNYAYQQAQAKCSYRGECHREGIHVMPCPYDEEPLPVLDGLTSSQQQELIDILKYRCPHLLYDDEGNRKENDEILTCCDSVQLSGLGDSVNLADSVLGRCPRCLRNFVRHICEMACSPNQGDFISVQTKVNEAGVEYVHEVDYRIWENHMDDTFDSCSRVVVPQTGLPAVNLMCGNAAVCNADAFYGFIGDTEVNELAPFQINFIRSQPANNTMNAIAPPCNETAEGDLPCSCVDCFVSCPLGSEPAIPDRCQVGSIHCTAFSVGITLFVLSVFIFLLLTMLEYKKLRSKSPSSSMKDNSNINSMTKKFQYFFSKVGGLSASYPELVLFITSWLTFAMWFGVSTNFVTNPLELWSDPSSVTRQHLNYFNTRFGPFYRPTQVYMIVTGLDSFDVDNVTYGPAFRIEAIREIVTLENKIRNIGVDSGDITLEEVCYAPLRHPSGEVLQEQCVVMSVSSYVGNDIDNINNVTYLNQIQNCLNNYMSFQCLAPWGGGSEAGSVFGGFDGNNILSANTLLINMPLANHLLQENLQPTLEWEKKFIELMHDYESHSKPNFIELAYSAERSIEDELERVSYAEILPIAISYLLMFIYVTLALGKLKQCKTWLLDSKMLVAVSSIIIVILAILCAMGVMGFVGYDLTLLAVNVVPFLVLSVGVDNVFLMVNTLHNIQSNLKSIENYKENLSFYKKRKLVFEELLRQIAPSMFLSSVTQITCFSVGTITNFPAVNSFAVFVSFSLAFLFVFQLTTVVAVLAIDYKRTTQNRLDVFCCIKTKVFDDTDRTNYVSVIEKLMKPYSKFITNWKVKIIVVILFMAMVLTSILLIPEIEIGLDQELALPADSYVYRYLRAVQTLLRLGPPVYFVLKGGLDFTNPIHQNTICGGQLCYDDSLVTQIFLASLYSNVTKIQVSSNSWMDDFFDWTTLPGTCCKYNTTNNDFCSSTDNSAECEYCIIDTDNATYGIRPSSEAFSRYIPFFLQDEPTDQCNKGGLASYSGSVNYILNAEGDAFVHDSNFMAFHVPLSSSKDYIDAVRYAYEISDNITASIKKHTGTDIEVFPYSVFYVFYEQYINIWRDTFTSLGYCMIGALLLNLITSGFNFLTTFAVIFTTVLVVVNMMGVMYIWSIPLNAVSCINLIVSIGIAVEYCSHIAYSYSTSDKPPNEKVQHAVQSVGPIIITGITFTNIPIIVLAFSYTEIIEVFFFRMLFSIVILGFIHGMIFFPVLLSYLNNLKYR